MTKTRTAVAAAVLAVCATAGSGCTVLGAGTGALVGAAVGRSAGAAAAGAMIGAAMGAAVDLSAVEADTQVVVYEPQQTVYVDVVQAAPVYYPPRRVIYRQHRRRRVYRHAPRRRVWRHGYSVSAW